MALTKQQQALVIEHGGVDEGFVSQYIGTLEGGNGVVVMTNTYNTALFDEIIRSVALTYKWNIAHTPEIKKVIDIKNFVICIFLINYLMRPVKSIIEFLQYRNPIFYQMLQALVEKKKPTEHFLKANHQQL